MAKKPDHQAIEQQYRELMNKVAETLDKLFAGSTFVLLVAPPGKAGPGEPQRRTNYISNGRREDMHRMMQELIDNQKIYYEKMSEDEKTTEIIERAQLAVNLAEKLDRVLTIEQIPRYPLKQGNYATNISVRQKVIRDKE